MSDLVASKGGRRENWLCYRKENIAKKGPKNRTGE